MFVHYGISKADHKMSIPPRIHETPPRSKANPLMPDPFRDAAETLETFGADDDTVAAAAMMGELALFSATASGEDRGARFAPVVVMRKP